MAKNSLISHFSRLNRILDASRPTNVLKRQLAELTTADHGAFVKHLLDNRYLAKQNTVGSDDQRERCVPDILGKLLLQNWKFWWFRSNTDIKSVHLADKEVVIPGVGDDRKKEELTINSAIDNYFHSLPSTTQINSMMAVVKVVQNTNGLEREKLVWKTFDGKAGRSGYQTQFSQLRFLKKFFTKPGNFHVSSSDALTTQNVLYNQRQIMDTTEYHSAGSAITLIHTDELLCATLEDSFSQRHGKSFLKIHPKLAPVKVAVIADTQLAGEGADIRKLAEETSAMLRHRNITAWDGIAKKLSTDDCDAIGVTFCVMLPDSVFENGVVYLRNLSTTIKTSIHMSTLCETIIKYLKHS